MAFWKQLVLALLLGLAGIVGWGALDPAARPRLIAAGVPGALLPEWAFLADPHDEQAQACYDEILEARARANGSLMTQVNLRVGRGWVDLARRGQPSPAVPEART